MPPASVSKPPPTRKRQRKRKRRVASSSESSSSSDSDSDSGSDQPAVRKVKLPVQAKKLEEEESSSSSSSSSDDSSDSGSNTSQRRTLKLNPTVEGIQEAKVTSTRRARRSPSPDIPINTIPPSSFLPETEDPEDDKRKQDELKGKFRRLWMSSIADAFKDDLEVIQKEPNMNPSRLAVLIESLASGADVFTSSAKPATNEVNEMEIIVSASEKRQSTQTEANADDGDVDMADEEE